MNKQAPHKRVSQVRNFEAPCRSGTTFARCAGVGHLQVFSRQLLLSVPSCTGHSFVRPGAMSQWQFRNAGVKRRLASGETVATATAVAITPSAPKRHKDDPSRRGRRRRIDYWTTFFPVLQVGHLLLRSNVARQLDIHRFKTQPITGAKGAPDDDDSKDVGHCREVLRDHWRLAEIAASRPASLHASSGTSNVSAVEGPYREATFDFDASDYDPVRREICTSCTGKQVCDVCLRLLQLSVKFADILIRSAFGFKHGFVMFSGRRGFHLTYLDEGPFTSAVRCGGREAAAPHATLAQWLRPAYLFKFVDAHKMNSDSKDGHVPSIAPRLAAWSSLFSFPSIKVALQTILPDFVDLYAGSGMLSTAARFEVEMKLAGLADQPELIQDTWNRMRNLAPSGARQQWAAFVRVVADASTRETPVPFKRLQRALYAMVLSRIWPRIDMHVTSDPDHLSRVPFSAHEATGAIAMVVPPGHVMTLADVLRLDDFEGGTRMTERQREFYSASIDTFTNVLCNALPEQERFQLQLKLFFVRYGFDARARSLVAAYIGTSAASVTKPETSALRKPVTTNASVNTPLSCLSATRWQRPPSSAFLLLD